MKAQPEFALQKLVAEYLRTAYPDVLFLSDVRASLRLTIPQQVRAKAIQAADFACPDMIIFEPSLGYAGMFLEFKAASPFKQNGEMRKSDHLERQHRALVQLRNRGYMADLYWVFNTARMRIDEYLRGRR
jgi:hypothetical protein